MKKNIDDLDDITLDDITPNDNKFDEDLLYIDIDFDDKDEIISKNGLTENKIKDLVSKNEYYTLENKIKNAMTDYAKMQEGKYLKDIFSIIKNYDDITKDSKYETKSKRMQLTIEPTLFEMIQDISDRTNTSINEIIRLAIVSAIDRQLEKNKPKEKLKAKKDKSKKDEPKKIKKAKKDEPKKKIKNKN